LKKTGILICFLFLIFELSAQKEANIWYFGNRAGLDFNYNPPKQLLNSSMGTRGGCSSISDSNGNLLFYTNGTAVWNKKHDTMRNGFDLFGSSNTCQPALIVQQYGKSLYYVFTCDSLTNSNRTNRGVCYSIVDMSLNNGNGAVVFKNKLLFNYSCGKISAVFHKNNRDVWIAIIKRASDSIYTYKLSDTGLSSPFIQRNIGVIVGAGNINFPVGQMKFSNNGKYLAYTNTTDTNYVDINTVHIMDFNNETGLLSNSKTILDFPNQEGVYGIEFAPNNQILYIGGRSIIFQIPIGSIKDSSVVSKISYNIMSGVYWQWDRIGDLQIAPDGKIYIARNLDSFLSVIQFPDSFGAKCAYKIKGVFLQKKMSFFGLPAFVQSSIYYPVCLKADTTCLFDSVLFKIENTKIDSVEWDFGDGYKTKGLTKWAKHLYNDSGNYQVQAKLFRPNLTDTVISTSVFIAFIKHPKFTSDTTLCIGQNLLLKTLDMSIFSYAWNTGSNSPSLLINSAGFYKVSLQNKYCKLSDSIRVKYGKKPQVFIGNDTAFCKQFSLVLDANNQYKDYLWNTGQTTYKITVNQEGQYHIRVIDSNQCPAADTINIDVIKKPEISLSLDSVSCRYVALSFNKQNGVQYVWNTGDTSPLIQVNQKGLYVVTASNQFCSNSDSILVNLLPKPVVNLGADTLICNQMVLNTNEIGKYQWSDGSSNAYLTVNKPGVYWLKVSRNNCVAIDTINLIPCKELSYFIPTAFSPNGDLNNDVFKVYGKNIKEIKLEIFNRWGEQLINVSDADPSWNGLYLNQTCQEGIYLYKIELKSYNGQIIYLNGLFTLLR
jgi:gliding motility-associated-like protein